MGGRANGPNPVGLRLRFAPVAGGRAGDVDRDGVVSRIAGADCDRRGAIAAAQQFWKFLQTLRPELWSLPASEADRAGR